MDFKQLSSFIEVANLKGFSKASKKMFLTQPTVTNHIQKLEEELGIILFNRTGREIVLTEWGSIFYNYAQEMINLKDTAIHHLDLYKCKIEGVIEINTSSIPGEYILPHLIKDFKNHHPQVCFKLKQTRSKKVHDLIKEGYASFGITGAKYSSDNIEYTKLMEDRLILALPPCYKNKYSPFDIINIKELITLPLILREEGSGTRYLIEKAFSQIGITTSNLNITAEVSHNDTIKKMLGLNIGTSFISELAIKEEIASGDIIPVKVSGLDLKRNFYFVCHKKRYLSPHYNAFKEFILDYMRND